MPLESSDSPATVFFVDAPSTRFRAGKDLPGKEKTVTNSIVQADEKGAWARSMGNERAWFRGKLTRRGKIGMEALLRSASEPAGAAEAGLGSPSSRTGAAS